MSHALVLGGAGFVGSHLVDALLDLGHRVTVLDNLFTGRRANLAHVVGDFEFVRGDVCEPFHFDGVDVVWHLACPASPVAYQRHPARTIETGVLGTLNALKFARDVGARLVFTSTSEVYGDPAVHPQPETYWGNVNPVGPRSCYDESKRCGESLCWAWREQYGVDVRVARLFNTYGPRMAEDDGRVVSSFVTRALRGEKLQVYGDGSQTRSFCYVSDTVRALVRFGQYSELRDDVDLPVVNVGNPDERTILGVAHDVLDAVGIPVNVQASVIEHLPLPKDDPHRRKPDITRAQAGLGWNPEVSYLSGIRQTVGWWRDKIRTAPLGE